MREGDLRSRLRATFVEELQAAVSSLRQGLTAVGAAEGKERRAPIDALLRTTHSLKGASRSARVDLVEHVCHLMEDILVGLRAETAAEGSDRLLQLLFDTTDALGETPDLLERQVDLGPTRLAMLLPHLGDAALEMKSGPHIEAQAPSHEREPPPPSSQTEPVDSDAGLPAPPSPAMASTPEATERTVPWRPTPVAVTAVPKAAARGSRVTRGSRGLESLAEELAMTARELAESSGKQVDLVVEGSPRRVDDRLVRRLRSPLRHLVRNAVDHGIETPGERRAAGKPPVGRLVLSAEAQGLGVRVTLRDDGSGIDSPRLVAAAERLGLAIPVGSRAITQLAFEPGVTTRESVDERSGRGIGLDAVRAAVEALGGTVSADSRPGQGSSFRLDLPASLEALHTVLFSSGGTWLALAAEAPEQVIVLPPADIRSSFGRPGIDIEGRLTPIVDLRSTLAPSEAAPAANPVDGARHGIVLRRGDERLVLSVDELTEPRRLSQVPISPRLQRPLIESAVALENGEIVFLLSPAALFEAALPTTSGENH